MKKVLKIFGAIILCLGVIALIVCMCAIPNETKLFFDSVFEYLDKPFVLCGVSVTIGGILLLFIARYILNNTSVGKKQINELMDQLAQQKDRESADYKNIKDLIDYNVDNANEYFDKVNKTINKLENALKQVPNKKVQEVLNNGKETKND